MPLIIHLGSHLMYHLSVMAIFMLLPRRSIGRIAFSTAPAISNGAFSTRAWINSDKHRLRSLRPSSGCLPATVPGVTRSCPPFKPKHYNVISRFATSSSDSESDVASQLNQLTVKDLKEILREKGLPTSGLKAELIERLSANSGVDSFVTVPEEMDLEDEGPDLTTSPVEATKNHRKKKSNSSVPKFRVNPNWRTEFNANALQQEFEKLAKKDGFDGATAYYAPDDTFEDDFDEDDLDGEFAIDGDSDFDMDDDDDGEDYDELPGLDIPSAQRKISMEDRITSAKKDQSSGRVSVPDEMDDWASELSLDELPQYSFGGGKVTADSEPKQQSMDDRIAATRRDQQLGRVTVPKELDKFSEEVSFDDLRKLGFRREINPFGNDETPRREQFKVISGAMTCSGCGSKFQQDDEFKPGYLPPEKYETQTKLSKIEEVQKMQDKAESKEWTPEDEIEWLIKQGDPNSDTGDEDMLDIDIDVMAERMGLDLEVLSRKKVLCKRCHGLQNFGTVEQKLRPGWTDEPTLSQQEFKRLLLPLKQKKAVILALVDLFDFSGSVLPELDEIAGENPVILAANKADLLPSQMGQVRAENWVRRELEYMNVKSIANIGGAVRLVSCKTGFGVQAMMEKTKKLAKEMECDIYVVGAANAGKSTLVNFLLDQNNPGKKENFGQKRRAGNANKYKGEVTTSPLPGTTLKFIRIDLGDGQRLYDTPGLLIPGSLTQRLTPEELKIVVPKKQVESITFRVEPGQCVLVGGLAKIELVGDSKPFLFTFFVANEIKLHVTKSTKADEVIEKHVGKMLKPPLEPGLERMEQIGEFEYHNIDVEGDGWKQAACDITLRGLGWVSVTGPGRAKVTVGVPKGIGVSVRPPLMPFDVWEATAKYTGGRAVRKSSKSRSGKRRKGVGRN